MSQKSFFNSDNWGSGFSLYKTKIPFDWNSFPQAFFPIIGIFGRDSCFHIQGCWSNGRTLNIETAYRGKTGHLYMHYNAIPDHRLIVSSIEFIHKHKGQMTELFSVLKEIRRVYRTGPIVIECVLTNSMQEWCKKNGLSRLQGESNSYIWPPQGASRWYLSPDPLHYD